MNHVHMQSGLTLTEILIALLLLSVGLLGLAGLQAQGLQSFQRSHWQTQAAYLAQDMAERLLVSSPVAPAAFSPDGISDHPAANICVNRYCQPKEMARAELSGWKQLVAATLPEGRGHVQSSGSGYRILVIWREENAVPPENCHSYSNATVDVACLSLDVEL